MAVSEIIDIEETYDGSIDKDKLIKLIDELKTENAQLKKNVKSKNNNKSKKNSKKNSKKKGAIIQRKGENVGRKFVNFINKRDHPIVSSIDYLKIVESYKYNVTAYYGEIVLNNETYKFEIFKNGAIRFVNGTGIKRNIYIQITDIILEQAKVTAKFIEESGK